MPIIISLTIKPIIHQETNIDKFKDVLDSSEKYSDPNAPEIYQKIRDDYHVFIDWKSFLDVKIKADHEETGRCDYAISKESFYTERAALAFGKDMQWIKKFDV